MKNNAKVLRSFEVLTLVLICSVVQVVITLPAYGDEIVAAGNNVYGQATPPAGNDFTAIAAGTGHALALKSDGSIVGWGHNTSGEATPPIGNGFKAIAAGAEYSLALKVDGSIVGWGRDDHGQTTLPQGNDFVAISAGGFHGLALRSDGSIVGWGQNNDGEATPPSGNDFVAIAAGWGHSVAMKTDGSIVCWGADWIGQSTPPEGNDFTTIAADWWHSLALRSDGSIVGWGDDRYGQSTPPAGNDFIAIAAGYSYSLALRSDGSIVGWGDSRYLAAPAGSGFAAISAGGAFSLALVPLLQNTPPLADAGGPYLVPVGGSVELDGSASYDPDGDSLGLSWGLCDSDSPLGQIEGAIFTASYQAGVTSVVLTVDDGTASDTDDAMLVVYDPEGGFVTGGGWIWSPVGAYVDDPTLEGKANFGFVSKYKKGAAAPTGNTEFVFSAGDLDFHSTSYDWLVVTGSNYAKFKGTGTVNGDGPYKFMLWAGDDDPDTFRIKIWWEDGEKENVVYDNGANQPIDGGSIMVHAGD